MKNIGIFLLALFLLPACKGGKEEAVEKETYNITDANTIKLTPAQEKNAEIITGRMDKNFTGEEIKLTGMVEVEPRNMVSVSAPFGGHITYLNLVPGNAVRRGQLLATITNPQFIQLQQEYLVAKSKRDYAGKDLERQRALNKTQAGSDKVYQQASAEYNTQQALMQSYASQLRLAGINPASVSASNIKKSVGVYAPISGKVHLVHVNPGKYVNPSDELVQLVNNSDVHISLKVFEKDLSNVYIGQKFEAYNNQYPDLKYEGNVNLIDPVLDENRSATIHGHFRKPDKALVPGMYMYALLHVDKNMQHSLPLDAVVSWQGQTYVFEKKSAYTYEMIPVRLGNPGPTSYEIKDGDALLQKEIVTKGAYTLLMALKNVSDE